MSLGGETLMGTNPATVAAKMARVEKHIRNNSLQVGIGPGVTGVMT